MKGLFKIIKWMAGQARPFVLSLFLITALGSVLSLCAVSAAVVSKNMIDAAVAGDIHNAVWAASIFVLLILARVGLRAVTSILSSRTLESMSNSMRQRLFLHICRSEWINFSKYHSEDILTRFTSDVGKAADGLVYTLSDIVSLGVGIMAAFITLLHYDSTLALMAFVLAPVSILLSRFFGRRLKHMHIKIQESESAYRALIHESIQNMLIVRAFCLEDRSINRIGRLQDERLKWVLRRSRMGAAASSVLSFGYWLGYFTAFGWGALQLSRGAATFGTLTAFLQLVEQIQGPFIGLAYTLPQAVSAVASSGRLMELEKMELEKSNCKGPDWGAAGVRLENVDFSYEENKPVLRNVSIKIHRGEITAFVGPSGEGKTTLVRLILGLLKPEKGYICFTDGCGEEFEACPDSRSLVSYVPQGNTLFSGTIRENLLIGCYNAADSELKEAACAACVWEFIEKMPDCFDTVIGERGIGLSEGQAQRIAIARALLCRAPVLILDEATSALDINTEICVLRAIASLKPARTCIIITHRPTAFRVCHRVLKLEGGRIVEFKGSITSDSSSEAV